MLVDDDKLTRQGSPDIEIGGESLKALVIAENLAGRSGRHRCQQEGIAHPIVGDFRLQGIPIPAPGVFCDPPHVELQDSFAGRTALERGVGAIGDGLVFGGGAGGEIYRLEYLSIQCTRCLRLEWHLQHRQGISQALYSEPNRAMAHIRILSFGHRVVIAVDDAIEISGDVIGDIE